MGRRYHVAQCAPVMLSLIFVAGAARAQEEVHIDGSVVIYDGATQRMSAGAHPIARILNARSDQKAISNGRASHVPPPEIAAAIHTAAQQHNVDERLVQEVAWEESRYTNATPARNGARGVMELMPSTAQQYGVDASDPKQNIDGGVRVLKDLLHRYDGDQVKALAAYDAGPGNVDRYGGVPPYHETQTYVRQIMGRLSRKDEASSAPVVELEALSRRMSASPD